MQHTRIGRMRLLDTNTANEPSCFRKKLPSMFVLIYPFTSQIFCINNDIMQRFTYSEKNRDDLLQYSMWSLVRASPRCPWSASFPKMIKYFVKKKNTLNNERYRDLLISILSYDEVSAFLLRVKTRN